jgi:hypothetical protein
MLEHVPLAARPDGMVESDKSGKVGVMSRADRMASSVAGSNYDN